MEIEWFLTSLTPFPQCLGVDICNSFNSISEYVCNSFNSFSEYVFWSIKIPISYFIENQIFLFYLKIVKIIVGADFKLISSMFEDFEKL